MYGNPGLAAWMREETVRRQWFWAGISNPANPLEPALSLSPVDGGFVVAGDTPGITYPPDWDNIGQRQSASGSAVLDQVRISDRDVLGSTPKHGAGPDTAPTGESLRLSLVALSFQASPGRAPTADPGQNSARNTRSQFLNSGELNSHGRMAGAGEAHVTFVPVTSCRGSES